jgi:hypothetical protein
MTNARFRALRIFLLASCLLTAAGGLVMIFSNKPLLLRFFLHPPESEVSTLLLVMTKEMGGVIVAFVGLLLFFAWRDPVRNVAMIDVMIVGLCVLAVTPLLSLYTLDVRAIYPASWFWARSLVRLALAALLYYLRPREALSAQA